MSCNFVTKDTIDLIVSGAMEMGVAVAFPGKRQPALVTTANAKDFGQMLWRQNLKAHRARYESYDFSQQEREVEVYEPRRFVDVEFCGLFALARYLDYQCHDHADYPFSYACLALRAIMGTVTTIRSLDDIQARLEERPFGALHASDATAFLKSRQQSHA